MKATLARLALAAILPFAAAQAAHAAPSAPAADWYPSVYGANDEIGAANLLTPDVIKQAVGRSE
ncbi:MAG: cyclase family protein, partial [Burkholderia sp.]|nr:cyclase family protein [Burkholderia sp.]